MTSAVAAVSALSFIVFVFLLSLYPLKSGAIVYNKKHSVSVLLLLVVFLFVPVGSLPAFVSLKYSALAMAVCCVAATVLNTDILPAGKNKVICLTVLSYVLLGCLLKFALEAGFPGELYSLDLLCSVNLWQHLNFYGKICAFFTILCFMYSALYCAKNCKTVFAHIFVILCSATVVCLVYSLNKGRFYTFGYLSAVMDFLCFWIIAAILKKAIFKITDVARH